MKISKTLSFFILLLSYCSSAQNNFYQDIFHDIASSFGDSKPVPQFVEIKDVKFQLNIYQIEV